MVSNRSIQTLQTIFFGVLFFLSASIAHAQFENYNHPELKWYTIQTEHFNIHFHSGQERTPNLIAKIAEEIYGPVTRAYHFEPDDRIDIIVRDHDDYSNGAAFYYDNKIEIWAPSLEFLLRGTNNWLRNVVTHEVTHMIQMQTARKVTRRIPAAYIQYIGYEEERRTDVLYGFPNKIISYPIAGTVIPGWFAEGVAQYHTMKLGYDYWDSHRDMILRMRALSDGIYSLDKMGVFGKTSIGNESVYNQGFSFVLFLANRFGDEVLEKISREMSSYFSLSIEKAISRATGLSAKDLYDSWRTDLEMFYLKQADQIDKNLVRGDIIWETGSANVYPKWSPDGKYLAFLSNNKSDYLSSTGLYIIEPGATSDKAGGWSKRKLIKGGVVSPPSWGPASKKIVYSKIIKNKSGSNFYDVFMYDIESKEERRLTNSMRARYPSFSPDGMTVYFVSNADGISLLNALNISNGEKRIVKAFNDGKDIFSSSVSPQGNRIVFAVSSNRGRDIAIINSDGSRFQYLLDGIEDDRSPEFAPDGRSFYYSSDKTGIYNIYEYDLLEGIVQPVTNVVGGAFMPTMDRNKGLVYSLYSSNGYGLARINEPVDVNPGSMLYEQAFRNASIFTDYDDSDYTPLPSIPYKFQYQSSSFLPRVLIDYGKPKLGVYVLTSDVLDKYSLFMGAAVNKDFDRDLFALFDFKKFRQTLFVELYNVTRYAEFFFPPQEKDEVVLGYWEVDVGARQKISDTQEVQAKGIIVRQSSNVRPIIGGKPFTRLKFDFYKGLNLNFQWRYRNILARTDSDINPSAGRKILVNYWYNSDRIFQNFDVDAQAGTLREVYKNYDYHKLELDWKEHFVLPYLPERSAFTFRLQGGLITKPVDDFLYFFAGGLNGLKGYSFYSIEGYKMLIGSLTYRFPLLRDLGLQFGPWYFDKLYGSVGYQTGDAWADESIDFGDFKSNINAGLRLDLFSFYSYPTKIGFDASYGFERVQVLGGEEGRNWKFYMTVLFGYDF